MPIYEYTCEGCGRKSSLFFRSIASAESDPPCPHCGEHWLHRRMSRVWSRRSSDDDSFLDPSFEDGGVPFYGGGSGPGGPYEDHDIDGDSEGMREFSDEDVAAFARETRQMAEMMGEPLDTDLDMALRHIEAGADPDDVLGELDAASLGDDSASSLADAQADVDE